MSRIRKGKLTVEMLKKGYTLEQVMAEMLLIFPGSGTTKNSVYFWASKTPGVSLSGRNDNVDKAAAATLLAKLADAPLALDEPEAVKPVETHEQMVARMRAEIEAEYQAEIEAEKARRRQARLVKKGQVG